MRVCELADDFASQFIGGAARANKQNCNFKRKNVNKSNSIRRTQTAQYFDCDCNAQAGSTAKSLCQ